MSGEPQSKGAGFTTTANTLREDATGATWEAFLQALPEATAALVQKPPLAVAWIDVRHFGQLITQGQRVIFAGDVAGIERVARRAIYKDLNTLYRMFIRLSSPTFVIQRAAKIWGAYNQNHGSLSAEAVDAHSARVFYRQIAIGNEAFWAYARGAIMATVDATGIKNGRIQLTAGGGVDSADFLVTWE